MSKPDWRSDETRHRWCREGDEARARWAKDGLSGRTANHGPDATVDKEVITVCPICYTVVEGSLIEHGDLHRLAIEKTGQPFLEVHHFVPLAVRTKTREVLDWARKQKGGR